MLNKSKRIILFVTFSLLIIHPSTSNAWHESASAGGWDYYGSGRDHPVSAYIDRANYVGPADYAPIEADYIDGPLVFQAVPPAAITTIPAPVITTLPAQYIVNIPNNHGGYNAVVIKKSGDGFIGPQGEYYPEFPKIFQLQMKYSN